MVPHHDDPSGTEPDDVTEVYTYTENLLPITLISFDAVADGMDGVLSWSTASEENNKHFIVERSLDGGVTFETIGDPIASLAVDGNSQERLDYSFVDKDAASWSEGIHYKVRQIDMDGTTDYTPIRFVDFSHAEIGGSKLFPNPVIAGEDVILHAKSIRKVEVFSIQGELVQVMEELNEQRSTSIDTSGLSKGVYMVVINGSETVKLVIQ